MFVAPSYFRDSTMTVTSASLSRLTYSEIDQRLKSRATSTLLKLLDDRSTKIGGAVVGILVRQNKHDAVLRAAMSDEFKTRNGKVRALNILRRRGRTMPKAIHAYLKFIHDTHPDVVESALFGLVFWNDRKHLPAIESIKNPSVRNSQKQAIKALKQRSPRLFSPHFWDISGVWKK